MKLLAFLLCLSILSLGMLVNGQVRAGQRRNAETDYSECRLTVDNLYRDNRKLRLQVSRLKRKLLEGNQ